MSHAIRAADASGTEREIEISHADKVFFPAEDGKDDLTKLDVARYYERVAEVMVPHLRDRPLTLHRYPDGIEEEGFYQKDAPDYFPDWIRTAEMEKEDGTVEHVLCDDAATLLYLANQGCVTPHVWLSRADRPRHPDRLVFDLDPPAEKYGGGEISDAALEELRWAARRLRDYLDELGLESRPMTTGSRGFHVVVALDRSTDFAEVRPVARRVAESLADEHPDRLTVEQRKKKRGERVFVDWLRNGYAQLAVAPYALRARPGAPVATPLDWDELGDVQPRKYRLANLFRRLGQTEDPWADLPKTTGASLQEAASRLG